MSETDIIGINNRLDEIKKLSLLAAKDMLDMNDVCLLTGLSKSHLYKLTHSRKIPYYKPHGKHVYFDRSEIKEWMKQNRMYTTDEIEESAATYIATGKHTLDIGRKTN